MTELRECPFCGGAATLSRFQPGPVWACGCDGCEIGFHGQKQPIVSAWNRRANAWQPIETAPRDGTRIMVSDGQNIWFDSQRVGKHAGPSNMGMPTTGHEFSCSGGKYPTHWRPLPKGPGG